MPEVPQVKAVAAGARQAAEQVGKGRPGEIARHWLWRLALACLLLFMIDSYYVLSGSYTVVDRAVELFVQGFPWGPVVYLFAAFNSVAGIWQLVAGLALALLMAFWDRRAGWLMFIGAGASLLDNLIKVLVARQRPASDLVHVLNPATGYSFPSGHAVFYTWVAVMLGGGARPPPQATGAALPLADGRADHPDRLHRTRLRRRPLADRRPRRVPARPRLVRLRALAPGALAADPQPQLAGPDPEAESGNLK